MPEEPEGTVTFLFTDIQGSTELLKQLHKDYIDLLSEERCIMRSTFDEWGGKEVDTQGDSFFVSFPRATASVAAVVEIQKSLATFDWPEGITVNVRMGMHTGEPWLVEEGYVGMDVHRLKDMRRPEHVYQLVIEGLPETFPPLESLEAFRQDGELIPDGGGVLRNPRPVGESPYRGLARTLRPLNIAQLGENRGFISQGDFEIWTYEGHAGEAVNIRLVADKPGDFDLSPDEWSALDMMDMVLRVGGPNDELLAYNNDAEGEELTTNALIEGLVLPADYPYRIEARSFNELYEGMYTLIIEVVEEP